VNKEDCKINQRVKYKEGKKECVGVVFHIGIDGARIQNIPHTSIRVTRPFSDIKRWVKR